MLCWQIWDESSLEVVIQSCSVQTECRLPYLNIQQLQVPGDLQLVHTAQVLHAVLVGQLMSAVHGHFKLLRLAQDYHLEHSEIWNCSEGRFMFLDKKKSKTTTTE